MDFVFLMDPLASIAIYKDTSFAFMLGAARRGHNIFYVPASGIHLTDAGVSFTATPVTPKGDVDEPFVCESPGRIDGANVDAVFVRTDPPFDDQYLMNTWLLDQLPAHVFVFNSPRGLQTVNEKVWTVRFRELIPPTLVSSDIERFKEFLDTHGKIVVKPTNSFGGAGVFIIEAGDSNAPVIFETLSNDGRPIIAQRYVPESVNGDKRILLLDGESLGAVLRVHSEGEHRNNFFAGGNPVATEITDRDHDIIAALKPQLRALGLAFVGIDVIGDYLIEVNVTSPTCLQEMNELYDVQLEDAVIDFVEKQVRQRRE
jgi:glutathione synthase